jgi:hypothetical protein
MDNKNNPPINTIPEVNAMDNGYNSLFAEVNYHYTYGTQDMETRKLRKNGWDDIIKAYYGKLPANWPYLSKVVDPVIRTALMEKTSRLFNGKLRGVVVPRESGDVVKSKIINAILDYYWDNAQLGGSMLEKWALMDTYTRLFGAAFALCYWRKTDDYDGLEFKVLDNRDVFVDYQANHVKNANWVQVREWRTLQDLKNTTIDGVNLYENLDELEKLMFAEYQGDRRDTRYTSMVKQLRGLEDRVGQDIYFKTVEVVTEYRKDKWITFTPRYGLILRDIENPLDSKIIPVVQLRYYQNGDDVYGESEFEAVLPIQRAINANLCAFQDQINFSLRPPIKVANNADGVRLDTIVYAPNALWLTGSTPNNIIEHQSGTQVVQQFSTTYQVLKSAFNTALGELSAGVSNVNPMATEKTATEVRATFTQMQSRDQFNQLFLSEALKDQMVMWIKLIQQFLFDDPAKYTIIYKITGMDILNELKRYALDDMEVPDEVTTQIADMIQSDPNMIDPSMIQSIVEQTAIPATPVNMTPNKRVGEFAPKMEMDKYGEFAVLRVTPDDITGNYDYIPDVKSMSIGTNEAMVNGRNQLLQLLLSPNVNAQLQSEGDKIKVKDLIISIAEDNGVRNAGKFFESVQTGVGQPGMVGGLPTPVEQGAGGITQTSPTNIGGAGPQGLPTAADLFAGQGAGVSQPLTV